MSDTGLPSRLDAEFARYVGTDRYRDNRAQCDAIRAANSRWQETHTLDADGSQQHLQYLQVAMLKARNEDPAPDPIKEARDRMNAPKHGFQFCGGRQRFLDESEVARREGDYMPVPTIKAQDHPSGAGGIAPGNQMRAPQRASWEEEEPETVPFGQSSRLLKSLPADKHKGNIATRYSRELGRYEDHVANPQSKWRPTEAERLGEDPNLKSVDVELEPDPRSMTRGQQLALSREKQEQIKALERGGRRGDQRIREHRDGSCTVYLDSK